MLLLLACSTPSAPPAAPAPSTEPVAPAAPTLLPLLPSRCPPSDPVDVLDFAGSCAPLPGDDPSADLDLADASAPHSPRPPLPDDAYATVLQVRPSTLGHARVRSRLVFVADDERNVLTTVPDCTALRLAGPMKNSSGSQGIGWSVRLRDPTGRACQGFLGGTVLGLP